MGKVGSEQELRESYPAPIPIVARKTTDHLDSHCVRFIARSPFLCLATTRADGRCDVSPRGDQPGFARVPDPQTILIPDRKGNNRLDSMRNILEGSGVGLLFLIPGIIETLRVNGRGEIVDDPVLMSELAAFGTAPKTALRVRVEEAFLHCGKALKRSGLWDADAQADRAEIPTIGQWLREELNPDEAEEETIKAGIQQEAREANDKRQLY